jgi:RNA-directed DNA polymerase
MPDTVGPDPHEPTSLRGIANKARADKQHRFRDLYRCLDANLLRACWDDLNKAAASGVDHVTAEEYAANLEANIEALAQRLKAQRYRAKLVRRCYIPKANGQERPLGIPMCPAYCISWASLLGIVLAEPAYLSQLHGPRLSLITPTSK